MNYYNEFDPFAAAWLRELISEKLIPRGLVDDRSITEVKAEDLEGFTQCHFFAGIGGWPLALQIAGVSHRTPLWTGSPPCQPFSVAGKQLGQLDDRHLAPTFMRLVDQCRPPVLFGEQVAAAISKHWLDDLFTELERQGYSCGAAVLPACSVGAPHKRDRLFFGATLRLGDASGTRQCTDEAGQHRGTGEQLEGSEQREHNQHRCADGSMADTVCEQRNGERIHGLGESDQAQGGRPAAEPTGRSDFSGMADAESSRPSHRGKRSILAESSESVGKLRSVADTNGLRYEGEQSEDHAKRREGQNIRQAGLLDGTGAGDNSTNPNHGFWSDADWLGCRDGKFRPVEPGTFPLANGIPARVGRLRGYGNAIVPQAAAEFIRAFMGAVKDTAKG